MQERYILYKITVKKSKSHLCMYRHRYWFNFGGFRKINILWPSPFDDDIYTSLLLDYLLHDNMYDYFKSHRSPKTHKIYAAVGHFYDLVFMRNLFSFALLLKVSSPKMIFTWKICMFLGSVTDRRQSFLSSAFGKGDATGRWHLHLPSESGSCSTSESLIR